MMNNCMNQACKADTNSGFLKLGAQNIPYSVLHRALALLSSVYAIHFKIKSRLFLITL